MIAKAEDPERGAAKRDCARPARSNEVQWVPDETNTMVRGKLHGSRQCSCRAKTAGAPRNSGNEWVDVTSVCAPLFWATGKDDAETVRASGGALESTSFSPFRPVLSSSRRPLTRLPALHASARLSRILRTQCQTIESAAPRMTSIVRCVWETPATCVQQPQQWVRMCVELRSAFSRRQRWRAYSRCRKARQEEKPKVRSAHSA